jgi:ABC-2 type transport system permease protein
LKKFFQKLLKTPLIVGFRKPLSFLCRDFINESSYKFAFISQIVGIFITTLAWFFLSNLFGGAISPKLSEYGGDYFSFVLVGIAFSNYLQVSLNSFSGSIRNAQTLGTLEAMLATQTNIPTIILSSSIYNFIITSFRVFVFLIFGSLLFDFQISDANYFAAFLVLIITIVCFSCLGIISASFIMVYKKGNPLNWIFVNLSWLLGGVLYPVSVLPEWLQKISYLLPITYSLKAMRLSLIKGYTTMEIINLLIPLIFFAGIMLPLSISVFKFAVKRSKIEGSLIQY